MNKTFYKTQFLPLDDLHFLVKSGKDGLVLQGCGGEPKDWIIGINEMLIKAGILDSHTPFQTAYVFQNQNVTCLLFLFDKDIKLDIGKLAIWRLQTHPQFRGTWLSDYVRNSIENQKEGQT